jgi:thioredoxin-dependent peroxiredoxin
MVITRRHYCARTLIAALFLPVTARAQAASAPAQSTPPAPALGADAPDFTLLSVATNGVEKRERVTLSELRGRVVVLAFYPGDKTTGCTAELGKFRDDYAALFGKGNDVVVLPISVDGPESHARWSSEMHFPFALLSDTTQAVAVTYGSTIPGRSYDNRTVFVVNPKGQIAYRNLRFGALSEDAYRDLAQAVVAAKN